MGTPDLRGTHGTFTFYTDDPGEVARDVPGGRVVRVAVHGGEAVLPLEGPANPLRKDRRPASVSIAAHVDRGAGAARFDLADQQIFCAQESGRLARICFAGPGSGAGGMARIFLKSVEPRLRVYVPPVNIDPAAPEAPISEPKSYSRDLGGRSARSTPRNRRGHIGAAGGVFDCGSTWRRAAWWPRSSSPAAQALADFRGCSSCTS
jgi:hypothetical protein